MLLGLAGVAIAVAVVMLVVRPFGGSSPPTARAEPTTAAPSPDSPRRLRQE